MTQTGTIIELTQCNIECADGYFVECQTAQESAHLTIEKRCTSTN